MKKFSKAVALLNHKGVATSIYWDGDFKFYHASVKMGSDEVGRPNSISIVDLTHQIKSIIDAYE